MTICGAIVAIKGNIHLLVTVTQFYSCYKMVINASEFFVGAASSFQWPHLYRFTERCCDILVSTILFKN